MAENLEQPNDSTVAETEPKKMRVSKVGKVVSDKMDKTIVVEVEYYKKHRLYKKPMRRHVKYKAHDENNTAKTGDVVRIEESRRYSKDKYFQLVEIIRKGVNL
jgi:small subunit ribosomal protein S17